MNSPASLATFKDHTYCVYAANWCAQQTALLIFHFFGAYHCSNCDFLAETHMMKMPYCHSGRGNARTCTYLWPSESMRKICFCLSVFWPGPVNSMSPMLIVTSPLPGDKKRHISELQQRNAVSPMKNDLNFRMLLMHRNPAHADVFVSASGDCSVKVCASCTPCYRHPCGGYS